MKRQITRAELEFLSERAERLAEQVLFATQSSSLQEIRREGARFGEVLEEWIEELTELYDSDDEAVEDLAQSFALRLKVAEEKVRGWYARVQLSTSAGKKRTAA